MDPLLDDLLEVLRLLQSMEGTKYFPNLVQHERPTSYSLDEDLDFGVARIDSSKFTEVNIFPSAETLIM